MWIPLKRKNRFDLVDIQGQIDEVDAEIAKANQTLANHFKELGVSK